MPPLQVLPSTGSNMVLNGGFEQGGINHWIGSYDPANLLTAPEFGASFGYNGTGGVRLNTGPDTTSRLIQQLGGSYTAHSAGTGELALAPNKTYLLKAKMKTTGGVSGTLTFETVRLFDTRETVISVTPATVTSSAWQNVTAIIQTGNQYAAGKIMVEAYKGTTAGQVYIDDIELIAAGGEFLATPTGVPASNPGVLFDDFGGTTLDQSKWLMPSKAWGGPNNGVVPENLSIVPSVAGDSGSGYLVMEAHGDLYNGPVTGTNLYGVYDAVAGKQIDPNKRVGSALATRDYYASGSYEVRAKIAPDLGAVTAFWTFHYVEDESLPGGKIRNTEIDWEFPTGANDGSVPLSQDVATFDRARLNTWGGYVPGEGAHHPGRVVLPKNAQGQNHVQDGKFHKYRFDWYSTGKNGDNIPRVEWYLDDQLVYVEQFDPSDTQNNIGYRAARYWLGVWFPAQSTNPLATGETGWGGTPNFSVSKAYIDWVRITPFTNQPNDSYERESTPNFGFALPHRAPGWNGGGGGGTDTQAPAAPTQLQSPAKTSASVSLNWNASTDNVGVTGYEIAFGGNVVQSAGTSATITGLSPGTAYTFTVKAKDAAGNLSAASAPLTVTTLTGGSANLLQNGDFSFALVSNSAQGWKSVGTGGASTTGGVLQLIPSAIDTAEAEQVVSVTPGQSYKLTASLSTSGIYGYIRVFSGSQMLAEDFTTSSKTSSQTFTAAGSSLRIVIHAYKQQAGTFTVDNTVLTVN
ncbi:family 16 glycosylhydrolase [Paenibacillus pasadenensis]|uniref:fibronectin type III domain-containing protein n=1 Tax=Paenibacillus pasadenensis TaxID=217090 RepID=UPI0020416136|nr:family 16 glycosylhydrolase [Paenibacillus pasadenensis]MCM3749522.1 family 16 glycosylhydrolase [Paenibacillus pasadenensis]